MLMKKLIVFIATLFISFPIFGEMPPRPSGTVDTVNGLRYYFNLNSANGRAVIIPDISSYKETMIGWFSPNPWHTYTPTYRSLMIPDYFNYGGYQNNVTSLFRMSHFQAGVCSYDNNYLEEVKLNHHITALPDSCFYRCVKLREFSFPEDMKTSKYQIGVMAFGRCPEFSIRLPRLCYSVSQSTGEKVGSSNLYYHFVSEIGDSIRRLEVVWSNPPTLEEAARQFEKPENLKPMFQYVDTLVVPKGCMENYADWADVKYGVLIEGDYEAEGSYPDPLEWYNTKAESISEIEVLATNWDSVNARTEVMLRKDSLLYYLWNYDNSASNVYGRASLLPDDFSNRDQGFGALYSDRRPTYRNIVIPDYINYKGYQRNIDVIYPMSHTQADELNPTQSNYVDNEYLETVKLNHCVNNLSEECFYRCVKLREFIFCTDGNIIPYKIRRMAFGRCPELCIRLPRFCYTISLRSNDHYKYHYFESRYLSEIGDSIRRLEVVWKTPPPRVYRTGVSMQPMFQYVDTLVVPRGCMENYADRTDVKYGVLMEGDYEAEGNYPNQYEWLEVDDKFFNLGLNYRVGILEVSQDSQDRNGESDRIYDLQGRAVTTPQRGRLYIRNQKKIVWN